MCIRDRRKTSYDVWVKFQGAGMGVARIYYTEIPGADSRANKLDKMCIRDSTYAGSICKWILG